MQTKATPSLFALFLFLPGLAAVEAAGLTALFLPGGLLRRGILAGLLGRRLRLLPGRGALARLAALGR
ncbi:MAG: hypothetical protein IJ617_07325, partial [Oscillospiraceae bacterium]|nr:hypothetical protein [Oscillospiraceae bacterium]